MPKGKKVKKNHGEWLVEVTIDIPTEQVLKALLPEEARVVVAFESEGVSGMTSMWKCGMKVLEVLTEGNRDLLKFRTWYRKGPKAPAYRREYLPVKAGKEV